MTLHGQVIVAAFTVSYLGARNERTGGLTGYRHFGAYPYASRSLWSFGPISDLNDTYLVVGWFEATTFSIYQMFLGD